MAFDLEKIMSQLKMNISGKRYVHSVQVMETAEKMAQKHGTDVYQARLAGILHDCAKGNEDKYRLYHQQGFDIILNSILVKNKALIHAPLGAIVARKLYGIEDEAVLSAIYYHTTARVMMTKLEKIIYIADKIEPGRKPFEGLEAIRTMAYQNLEEALLMCLDSSITFTLKKNELIHPNAVHARNYYLLNKGVSD